MSAVPRWRAELALVANTLIWGSTFVVVKRAIENVSPFLFLALRFSLATLVLLLVFRKRLGRPPHAAAWRGGVFIGGFLFLGYAFQTAGLRYTSAPKSAFLTGLTTVIVPLLAALVYRNRPRVVEMAGVLLATAGMGLMTMQGETLTMGRGDLLTLGCAVAYAAHIVVLGHYSGEAAFEWLSLTQVAVAALIAMSLFWWAETPRLAWTPQVVFAVGVTGVLATALAFTVQAWAQQYTTATRTALIFALEPVFAWLTSFALTGETLSGRAAAGAFLILGGVILVELKPFSRLVHPL